MFVQFAIKKINSKYFYSFDEWKDYCYKEGLTPETLKEFLESTKANPATHRIESGQEAPYCGYYPIFDSLGGGDLSLADWAKKKGMLADLLNI